AVSSPSAARALDPVTVGLEQRLDLVALIALQLDDAVLHRPADPAARLQRLGQRGEVGVAERQAGDPCHAGAFAALGLAHQAHDAVAAVPRPRAVAADAVGERPPAAGAEPSPVGGVDEPTGCPRRTFAHRCRGWPAAPAVYRMRGSL